MAALQHLKLRVSENNGLPWTQTQEYMSLCRTMNGPGDPSAYNPAHPQGLSPTDLTQFQVGLAHLKINNLPDVMYQLWPSKEWWDHTKSARPLPKRDASGSIMYERTPRSWTPRELLDFPILRNLDTISSDEDAWFLEMLLRMDGRIEWTDLLMRMEYSGTTEQDEQKVRNRLQQRMARMREKFTMVSWRDTAGDSNAIRDRVLNKLTPAQLAARGGLGTTRGSTPGSMDSQGRVIPTPGRRVRGSAHASNTTTQAQQPQSQSAHAGPSHTSSDQTFPVANARFPAVNVHQNRPFGSHRSKASQQPYTTVSQYPGPSYIASLPSMSGGEAANYRPQNQQVSAAHDANGTTQHFGNNTFHAGPYQISQDSDSPSGDRSEDSGIDSAKGRDMSDGSKDEDEDGDGDRNDDDEDGEYETEQDDASMPLIDSNSRLDMLTAEEHRELQRYFDEDRIQTQMCLGGRIALDKLMLDMQENELKLKQGLKRARGEVSDDDEVEEMQNQRAKRTRRGGDAAGSRSQAFSGSQGLAYSGFDERQSGSSGRYHRQGALASTSRRPNTRAAGSAVQRLHNDRLRRPAPKATQSKVPEFPSYHQSGLGMGDNDYPLYMFNTHPQQMQHDPQQEYDAYMNTAESQHQDFLHHQHQEGTETFSSHPNLNVEGLLGNAPAHVQNNALGGDLSSNSATPARNGDPYTVPRRPYPRRPYNQPTASAVQDDPFFSDELLDGMVNGQPNNNHVGDIYTGAQQRKIDDYYRQVVAPRAPPEPETNASETPPFRAEEPTVFVADLLNANSRPQAVQGGQQFVPYNFPGAPAHGHTDQTAAQVPNEAPQPVEVAGGDITDWDPSWSAFVNDHDAELLLRAHYPDE